MKRLLKIRKRLLSTRTKRGIIILFLSLAAGWTLLYCWVPDPLFQVPYSTLLYAFDRQLLSARIASDEQWRFPAQDTVCRKFEICITTFEDKRFFYHPGVDPLAVGRAIWQNLKAGKIVSGASSLTMQIARLARRKERTITEKIIETCWAFYLETRYSKRELLAIYANHAPFGGNVVGLETASWRYFGRNSDQLSWAESATLAILPNAPALIHPGKNRKMLLQKRNALLKKLHEQGIIETESYELACLEPLPEAPVSLPDLAPHLLSRLGNGQRDNIIVSTLNSRIQKQSETIVRSYAQKYRSNFIYNIAALIADTESGEVIAYIGNTPGLSDDHQSPHVDIVTSSRSTGSVLKPFLYAAMLHDGLLLPSTLVPDIPLNINGFTPQNYNKTFYGSIPAHRAIEQSLNVPLVRMLSRYNTGKFLSLLKKTGMTTLRFSEDHYGAALILGGAEGTLWDMTGMYASLARSLKHYSRYNGRYDPEDIHPLTVKPLPKKAAIQSVSDSRLTDYPLYSAAAIWHTLEAMSALNRPEEEADWQQFESMKKIAWKTGTSYGNRDAWAIGVTPQYTIGIWVGNATGEGRSGLTGVGTAAPILFDLFSILPAGPWFDEPYDDLEPIVVCRRSGHKASEHCFPTDTLLMPRSGIETSVCPYHIRIHLSPDKKYRVNSSCEQVDRMESCSWFVLPPAQEYYYRNYHVDYEPLPPVKPGCNENLNNQIEIIYPENGAILLLPKGFDGEKSRFVFSAAHARDEATLYWHLDHRFLCETHDSHQITCDAETGTHTLTVVDERGQERKIQFEVK